jgi:hypothetical protein
MHSITSQDELKKNYVVCSVLEVSSLMIKLASNITLVSVPVNIAKC